MNDTTGNQAAPMGEPGKGEPAMQNPGNAGQAGGQVPPMGQPGYGPAYGPMGPGDPGIGQPGMGHDGMGPAGMHHYGYAAHPGGYQTPLPYPPGYGAQAGYAAYPPPGWGGVPPGYAAPPPGSTADPAAAGFSAAMGDLADKTGLGMFKDLLNFDDGEFWKGALVGAAVVLLMTNDELRNSLIGSAAKTAEAVKAGFAGRGANDDTDTTGKDPDNDQGEEAVQ